MTPLLPAIGMICRAIERNEIANTTPVPREMRPQISAGEGSKTARKKSIGQGSGAPGAIGHVVRAQREDAVLVNAAIERGASAAVRLKLPREIERKDTAFPGQIADVDVSVIRLGGALANRQPQADSRAVRAALLERLE
jgi:hypothetical protein